MSDEIDYAIMYGISFKGIPKEKNDDKVKTKARKRSYKNGMHNSGAARHKAEIRQKVRNRKSQKH